MQLYNHPMCFFKHLNICQKTPSFRLKRNPLYKLLDFNPSPSTLHCDDNYNSRSHQHPPLGSVTHSLRHWLQWRQLRSLEWRAPGLGIPYIETRVIPRYGKKQTRCYRKYDGVWPPSSLYHLIHRGVDLWKPFKGVHCCRNYLLIFSGHCFWLEEPLCAVFYGHL